MRLLKRPEKIRINEKTNKVVPFRTFRLTGREIEAIKDLPKDKAGDIKTTHSSENLLHDILESRGMESLLYPKREQDDWSGYCKLFDDGLFWML